MYYLRVHDTLLDSIVFSHSALPGARYWDGLRLHNNISRRPLFQTAVFCLIIFPGERTLIKLQFRTIYDEIITIIVYRDFHMKSKVCFCEIHESNFVTESYLDLNSPYRLDTLGYPLYIQGIRGPR